MHKIPNKGLLKIRVENKSACPTFYRTRSRNAESEFFLKYKSIGYLPILYDYIAPKEKRFRFE